MANNPICMGLYTLDALAFIKALPQLLTRRWPTTHMRRVCGRFAKAEIAPDGEIILPPEPDYCYEPSVLRKPNADILKWIAIHMKISVKDQGRIWRRSNCDVIDTLCSDGFKFTVSDVYVVYDTWLMRKNIHKKFSKEQLDKMVGVKRDAFTTELEVARRAEIIEIKNHAKSLVEEAQEEFRNKCYDYKNALQAELDAKIKEIHEERDRKLKEINDKMLAVQGLTSQDPSFSHEPEERLAV